MISAVLEANIWILCAIKLKTGNKFTVEPEMEPKLQSQKLNQNYSRVRSGTKNYSKVRNGTKVQNHSRVRNETKTIKEAEREPYHSIVRNGTKTRGRNKTKTSEEHTSQKA